MNKIVIASTRENAGKTSVILGMAKALGKNCGYIKPLGDRLLYRKKRLWDYDSALATDVLGINETPEGMSLGFEHTKLKYMYNEEETKKRLNEISTQFGEGKDALFVEAGADLSYGSSVNLDAISVANYIDGKLVLVASGEDEQIVDDICFAKRYLDDENIKLSGVIINKVKDLSDFNATQLDAINKLGIEVYGVIPYKPELSYISVSFLAEALFAKVIAGESGLKNFAENIFVGAMSGDAVLASSMFKTSRKLIITSGDRSDMILAALKSDTSGIILTNNILPPPNIISQATEKNIPLLLVPGDTFKIAKQIDDMEPLLTKYDTEKLDLLSNLVKETINIDKIVK